MDKIFVDEAVNELQTIQDMLRWSVSRFSAANIWYGHGTDNPWDEAVQLVLPSLYLPLDIPEDMRTARLTSSEKHRIVERVIRRVNERIPVAYLTNKAWFCGHEFYVDERVLVPRSPIGELINNKFAGLISKQPQHILNMCTGSGCIAIACAYAFPEAEVDAVDISPDALAVAEQNIEEHGLIHNVIPIRSDLFRDFFLWSTSRALDLLPELDGFLNAYAEAAWTYDIEKVRSDTWESWKECVDYDKTDSCFVDYSNRLAHMLREKRAFWAYPSSAAR